MKNSLPKITDKQIQILIFLYRFRYLNRPQIQTLMKHKNHRLIQSWLNEMKDLKLIKSFFNKTVAASPTVYALDLEGRKYLRKNAGDKVDRSFLSKGWRDKSYTEEFRNHCMFLADVYLSLTAFCDEHKSKLNFHTKTDLYGMKGIINPGPDAFFAIKDSESNTVRYFIDVFDDIAKVFMRKRIKEYFAFFDSGDWEEYTNTNFPEVIIICPDKKAKGHLFFYIQNKLNDDEPRFYLTTKEQVLTCGLRGEILEKVPEKE